MIELKIDGLQELEKKLREMAPDLARNALRAAVGAAAKVVKDEASTRAEPHKKTGALQANIYAKRDRKRSNDFGQTYIVGVRNGQAKYANNKKNRRAGRAGKTYEDAGATFYWRFLEFGTVKMSPKPFLRPAFETKKVEAVEAIKERLWKRIEKIAKQKR